MCPVSGHNILIQLFSGALCVFVFEGVAKGYFCLDDPKLFAKGDSYLDNPGLFVTAL